ncbi:MAG: hypothetical protein LAT66_04255 [Alkalimonas sp.]|nr:hypothetical protein [Saccharospirillum sp.]MCH8536966.1 hypothetical protein [Alkalimonas sp.]
MNIKGVVVTTVNPFGDIENQFECFSSWKRAGYEIKSYNAKVEADLLIEKGFSKKDIVLLKDSDTTYSINKKYLPRVLPIIEQLVETSTDFILTNSDIFAFHSLPLGEVLKSIAPAFAFTRRELLSFKTTDLRDNEYYRGGLDAFYISGQANTLLVAELKNFEAADSMAFGIPGWDYLMGAIIDSGLNGIICDGAVIGHKYHKNTYSGLDAFAIYAPGIAKAINLESSDPYFVAEHFSRHIIFRCSKNVVIRNKLANFYHSNGSKDVKETLTYSYIELRDTNGILANADRSRLQLMLAKVKEEGDWGLANHFVAGCFVRTKILTAKLFSLWNYLEIFSNERPNIILEYPPGNLHAVAIKNCMSLVPIERDMAIFDVFATELVNHNIFNTRLYDYLVWTCSDSKQLNILTRIKDLVGEL